MYEYKAKVKKWVDGDTLLLEIDLGFFVTREERIRLARINTPELNSLVPYQLRRAKHARAVAKKFCPLGSRVTVKTKKSQRDMYARYIGEVYFQGRNISDYLLEKKVAKVLPSH